MGTKSGNDSESVRKIGGFRTGVKWRAAIRHCSHVCGRAAATPPSRTRILLDRQVENTLKFGKWLEAHPCVAWVNYLGLPSHLDYERAKKVLPKGAGAVLTFSLKLYSHLANVGDAKTLIIHPWRMTHQQIPDQEKIRGGVTPDMIRVGLVLEHIDDIIFDFEQAFESDGMSKEGKGWTPTWTQGMQDEKWNKGTLYAPNPNAKPNGTTKSEKAVNGTHESAAREVATSAQVA
jgi:O-acetylhomoserine/O-acetylserine sulfhydrylase